MTIAEAERFYDSDEKKYIVSENKEFLSWYKDIIELEGYNPFLKVDEIEELIKKIVTWYEIKYPERAFDFYSGINDLRFNKLKRITNELTFDQLKYRLSDKEVNLLDSTYRARGYSQHPVYDENGKIEKLKASISMRVTKKTFEEDFNIFRNTKFIFADLETGIIEPISDLKEIIGEGLITVEELLETLDMYYFNDYDFEEVKSTVMHHKYDLELRKRVLELTALNLLYSENTIPEYGYERAKRFIGEVNKRIPGINISTSELDEIMHADYTGGEKWEWVTEKFTDAYGNEYSIRTLKNLNEEPIETSVKEVEEKEKTSFVKKLKRIIKK